MQDYNMQEYDYESTYGEYEKMQKELNADTQTKQPKKRTGWRTALFIVASVLVLVMFGTSTYYSYQAYQKAENAEIKTKMAEYTASKTVSQQTASEEITLLDVSDIVSEAMPSVVSITSRSLVSTGGYRNFWDYYSERRSSGETTEVESGIGSGTIVGSNDEELLILTSYHVVEGCSSLYVTFNDDESVDGYIKSASEDNDIAVVAVPLKDIKDSTKNSIKIATLSTEDVSVGDGIIVIGDALGYGQSVVTGIISATDRDVELESGTLTLLQTDAAINSGNSGGCMLNAKGEIVGISEAKITMSSVEGMCYAIPVKENYELIQQLLTTTEEYVPEETQEEYYDDYYDYFEDFWPFGF